VQCCICKKLQDMHQEMIPAFPVKTRYRRRRRRRRRRRNSEKTKKQIQNQLLNFLMDLQKIKWNLNSTSGCTYLL
jgi:hypothetical protein